MTFTYDPTSDIGKVRRLIGDTVAAESVVTDEDIAAWLADAGNSHERAAVKILRSLAAKYSRMATITSGNEKIEYGNVAKNLLSMVADLEGTIGEVGSALVSRPTGRV